MTPPAAAAQAAPHWVLDTTPTAPLAPPALDAEQGQVVAHGRGPLLVLAGPGTGKTTTIVESVVARLAPARHDQAGPPALDASQILVLTFGRRAAADLRERIMRRLGGGQLPVIATFHSFAFGLVRAYAETEPPSLLSGAEQDVRIRELLHGAIADGTIDWPSDLDGAVETLGLANEVRAVLARARELGLTPHELRAIGEQSQRPAWTALGAFAQQESDIQALENTVDYGELLHLAVALAADPVIGAQLRTRFRAIYVDELQDTDPVQMELLDQLADPSGLLVAVGDPDQSIYGFRGTDVGGLLTFRDRFRTAEREPAPVVVLRTTRRFGSAIRDAATRVLDPRGRLGDPRAARAFLAPPSVVATRARYAARLGLPAEMATLSVDDLLAHRHPVCAGDASGSVAINLYDTESARAAHIAHAIRAAHVREGVSWSKLAVIVRTSRHLPVLFRAMLMAGVPASIARDEIPLREEPSVRVLITAAQAAEHPERISETQAADLLTGPLGGLDSAQMRELGRRLRAERRKAGEVPPHSAQLLREVIAGDADLPPGTPHDIAHRVRRLLDLLDDAGRKVEKEAPGQVLWALWAGGGKASWAERLRAAALAGSRSASHDIDAVMGLFDAAERAEARRPRIKIGAFIAAIEQQHLPAEAVAERGVAPDSVRLLTAHRAKGLQWDRIWAVGAEEGEWPDLRQRGSVLQADRLTPDGVGEPLRPADLLAEERRLFYVAITRAREQVTVASLIPGDDHQPSRFVDDLGIEQVPVRGWPRFPTSLPGIVAELRATATDESASPALRDAAVARLARLAGEHTASGRALAPDAHPARWWGINELTPGVKPVRPPDAPVELSGSALERLLTCPLQWFLDREARASAPRASATAFGSVVHAVAHVVARGDVPATLEATDALVDEIWSQMHFDASWQSRNERQEARLAVERFLAYHLQPGLRDDRVLESVEEYLETTITVPTWSGEEVEVALRGYLDRIEVDASGRAVAIDLKNMRTAPTGKEIEAHAQLGVYQLLLRESERESGGAGLVQLRLGAGMKAPLDPKVQMQPALPTESKPTWIEAKLGEAALTVREEAFVARPSEACTRCDFQAVCPARVRGEQVVP